MKRVADALRLVFVAAQAAWTAVSLYQAAITVAGRLRRTPSALPVGVPATRFGLVICARNEEAVVADAVDDLLTQDYPRELFEVLVVAHNCTDGTVLRAREAGAQVIELETSRPGKRLGILAALNHLDQRCDFIGVFDADSRAAPGLLAAVAAAAGREQCLQVEAAPRPAADWLATGYGLGRRARNALWWRPREALGLGTTISGTGFFIRPPMLHRHLGADGPLTEDLELTARMGAEGVRVRYLSATSVQIDEPHSLQSSLAQRLRWARGHWEVVHRYWPLLARRASRGDFRAFDLALYMVMPTRLLTRTGVTLSLFATAVRLPGALPARLVLPAAAGEWLLPALVGWQERLVPLTPAGFLLVAKQGLLNLLWFPIGVAGLVTWRNRSWAAVSRAAARRTDAPAPL